MLGSVRAESCLKKLMVSGFPGKLFAKDLYPPQERK